MKIVTTRKENLNIFLTTQGISIKFSGKITIMKILKVTKNQSFTLSLEDTSLKKPQGEQIDPQQFKG